MKSNRMFGILCMLLENEKTTAKELADYFEVSVRTIHRDLLDLSSAGFPVITQQGVNGGVSLLSNFKYNKSALTKEDMDLILAGIQGFASIDDSSKIKTLLAKLRLVQEDKMLLENDIIIDFTSRNQKSTTIKKIKTIRTSIDKRHLLELKYFSGRSFSKRIVEPYKLIFKQGYWYLFAYCNNKKSFRLFKVNRISDIHSLDTVYQERTDYKIPTLQDDFIDDNGVLITAKLDKSIEFLAIDFFGEENITKVDEQLLVNFRTQHIDWVISTFASFGNKAEIINPKEIRNKMKSFLEEVIKNYQP